VTYQELYLQHLETCLEAGGKQDDVEKAVAEFNAPTKEAFETWIKGVTVVLCSTCGALFKPDNPEFTEEIQCTNHPPKPEPTPTVH
jgi:hypothetical protein